MALCAPAELYRILRQPEPRRELPTPCFDSWTAVYMGYGIAVSFHCNFLSSFSRIKLKPIRYYKLKVDTQH
ncbi:hypothetical protein AG1IA_09352 [Rhizoctonia solani AG-1 IA]|uniref:Uncharacterized protein n=1 Tax=Thanatephorus cucumeris (strain AG1-IA) TaxID=983506 RepID=L8WII6_THACA|nr:hypothetical protein AG1IA_09352 [Rhizoctonia solani AG-1 IA]